MLLMVENSIKGEICPTMHWCAKANNKYMKDYDNKNVTKIACKWF